MRRWYSFRSHRMRWSRHALQLSEQGVAPGLLLAKECVCVSLQVVGFRRSEIFVCQHKDGYVGGLGAASPFREQFESAEAGKNEIENDELWRRRSDVSESVRSIGGGADGISSF